MRLENFSRRSKPLERNQRISEQGANRSKETREFQQKDQTARKRLENFRTRSRPLSISEQGANRSKETREFQQKEQTARKELESFRTRSKPLERG